MTTVTQFRKAEQSWWESETKAVETPFFDLADFARDKRREEQYQNALVDVFEQITLSPKPRQPEPAKEQPKNDLVSLPDIYSVAQTAPAPIVDWPLVDDHHRNKNTNPFLEDVLTGNKERLLGQAIDTAKADTAFLGAFADEPAAPKPTPQIAPLVFESAKQRKKLEKLAKKQEKQARKNSKKAAKYSDSLDSRTLFTSDPVTVTHVKKGTGKTKRGRFQIKGKDEVDDFPDTEPEVRDALEMMHPPTVIRKEYTGSSTSGTSSEDDIVQWWSEDVPKEKEKKTKDVAARRKRTNSAKEVDNSELEARAQRKRALSLPLSRSHGSLKSTKEEKLRDKEIRRKEKKEAKMKEAKMKEKEAKVKSPRKLSGKERRSLVPSYNAENSMAY